VKTKEIYSKKEYEQVFKPSFEPLFCEKVSDKNGDVILMGVSKEDLEEFVNIYNKGEFTYYES
jgi:hypothetical protein